MTIPDDKESPKGSQNIITTLTVTYHNWAYVHANVLNGMDVT